MSKVWRTLAPLNFHTFDNCFTNLELSLYAIDDTIFVGLLLETSLKSLQSRGLRNFPAL